MKEGKTMKNFIHHIPTKIIFGPDQTHQVGQEVKAFGGTKVLLMYGKNSIKTSGLYDIVVKSLTENGISFIELPGIKPNPSIESVRIGQKLVKENGLDFILAVGGGSVVDAAKAVSSGAFYEGDPWDFYTKKAVMEDALPIGTIITLAATGSEMNTGGVISNEETEEKLAYGHPKLRPVFTFEDPTLMYSLPAYQTAAGATDICSHILEQYFSSHEDEGIQDRMAEAMFLTVIDYGRTAIDHPTDYDARANLMWTSTLALNNLLVNGRGSGDWATHGIEHEVSAIYDITHGAGLAILFPHLLKVYLEKDIAAGLPLTKFVNLARNVFKLEGTDEVVLAEQAIQSIRDLFTSFDMPVTLADEKVDGSRIADMAKRVHSRGFSNVYHTLSEADVVDIYERSL